MSHMYITPSGVVEAGAVVPGLAGDAPGGGVVPVDSGTVPSEVGPVIPVVTGGMVETIDSVDGIGVVTVQQKYRQYNAV